MRGILCIHSRRLITANNTDVPYISALIWLCFAQVEPPVQNRSITDAVNYFLPNMLFFAQIELNLHCSRWLCILFCLTEQSGLRTTGFNEDVVFHLLDEAKQLYLVGAAQYKWPTARYRSGGWGPLGRGIKFHRLTFFSSAIYALPILSSEWIRERSIFSTLLVIFFFFRPQSLSL